MSGSGWATGGSPGGRFLNAVSITRSRHVGSTFCADPYQPSTGVWVTSNDNSTPFRSAHGIGAQFVLADGSVRWVDGSIDNLMYRLLAIRDSGQVEGVE
jgi:hypothetical protein